MFLCMLQQTFTIVVYLFRLSCFHGYQTQSNFFFSDDIFHIFHNFQRREFVYILFT